MRIRLFALIAYLAPLAGLKAQPISKDSTLQAVTVHAYAAERSMFEVPAAVAYIDTTTLHRFSNSSLLPVVNMTTGVRMEERSPGSYRFSIRGSTMRSPFGVRNVKIYWNGLPFTDAGGNTYLNLLDNSQLGTVEIIKGPAGSLYGAGTGGALLLTTPSITRDQMSASAMAGSYGLQRYTAGVRIHREKVNAGINYSYNKSDGYRDQTAMERHSLNGEVTTPLSQKSTLGLRLLYTDLYYETPGGLTLAQFNDNPRQARPSADPPSGHIAGAEEQQASVHNKTGYFGLVHDQEWTEQWQTLTTAYGTFTEFSNPAIRNYEERDENGFGLRTLTRNVRDNGHVKSILSFGAEYQLTTSKIEVSENNQGDRGTLLTDEHLKSRMFSLFVQEDVMINETFNIVAGLSSNFSSVDWQRNFPVTTGDTRKFDPVLLPRVALLKKLVNKGTDVLSVFASYSYGFSPPTLAELYPSRQIFDQELDPEKGGSVDVGLKGNLYSGKLRFDITGYLFGLRNTIVLRRDASLPGEPEYFVNAGSTTQNGLETFIAWSETAGSVKIDLSASHTYNYYRFRDYTQGDTDLSGNHLTGAPANFTTVAADLRVKKNWYLNVTVNRVDRLPLDDANTVFASKYETISARAGYIMLLKHGQRLEYFAGVENATDEIYSLGHDLNAAGGRYYNTAPGRSFYGGIKLDVFPR
jgi:iron complex outermembrane receptor protein